QYRTILDTQGAVAEPLNTEYITRKIDELATKVDTGSDTEYELTETGVIVYRGSEHTVIDKNAAKFAVQSALENYEYSAITVETTKEEPELPNLEDLRSMIYLPAANAYYDVDADNNTIVVDHVIGYDIDIEEIRRELEEGTWVEKAFAKVELLPEITTETLPDQYFKDLLGRGVSYYNAYEVNRTANVNLAASSINECIVLPGQTFSFNRVVGERTAEKGYKPATIYQNGGMQEGLGGGICQVTSTLYVATLNAELTQVSRYVHAYTVSYVELGMDATVYWGVLDYVFRNNTDEPIKIVATSKNGTLTISIYGHDTRDANRTIKFRRVILETYEQEMIYELDETLQPGTENKIRNGQPGYKVELYKQIYVNGVLQNEVKVNTSKYSKYDGLTKVGPELPETLPPETTPVTTTPPPVEPPVTDTTPSVTTPAETQPDVEPPVAVG
ncbi:MAG: VanW family protein, partial [Clostridia bacterium]|nr:VanW family protein [Clostridia bacterium]